MGKGNRSTLKMVIGKPFGITKIGARIMSIITEGGHEVTRNLSEPSDQTVMHIDVYADYLSAISPQTPSIALRALLTRGGSKSVRIDNRYTEAYGQHEIMLNKDSINICTKTMITFDEDLAGQIYVGRKELKKRSIGHCAMLKGEAMHLGKEADMSAHVLDIIGKKTQLRGFLDTGAVLSVIPIETWRRMGFDKDDLIDSRIGLSAANKGALRLIGRTPIIALNLGNLICGCSFREESKKTAPMIRARGKTAAYKSSLAPRRQPRYCGKWKPRQLRERRMTSNTEDKCEEGFD